MAISREIKKAASSIGYSSLKKGHNVISTVFLGVLPTGFSTTERASTSLTLTLLLIYIYTQKNQDITGNSYKSSKSV